jgi:Rieske Fe-S protein
MSASLSTKIKQGILYPRNLVQGRIQKPKMTVDQLQPGSGAIVEVNGEKIAAYKNDAGEITHLSAVCTHLGCIVGWNGSEKTWDCPCHGSRFSKEGKVINGPATTDLPVKEIS